MLQNIYKFKKQNITSKINKAKEVINMFGKELAHDESYIKEYGDYKVTHSYTVYETFIEEMHDKDGKLVTNKDGSPRYRYIDPRDVTTIIEAFSNLFDEEIFSNGCDISWIDITITWGTIFIGH